MAIDVEIKQNTGGSTGSQSFKVGWFEGKIVATNPSLRKLNELLETNFTEQREQKNRDEQGNLQTVLELYLQNVKTEEIYRTPLRIILVDKPYTTKNGKTRFIDKKGNTSFPVDGEESIPDFMKENGYWQARQGESQLYELLRAYLNNINWKATKEFVLDWKKLMEGDVDELLDLFEGPMAGTAIFMMQIDTYKTKEGEEKQKQSVYPFKFIPGYYQRQLTLQGYTMQKAKELNDKIKSRMSSFNSFKPYEHYVADLFAGNTNEFSFRPVHDWDPDKQETKVESGSFVSQHNDDDIF